EGRLLSSIQEAADLLIDTSQLPPHDLRNLVRNRVGADDSELSILVQSIGFKHGTPNDADLLFDVRMLPNPYWDPDLRLYNGLQQPVINFLNQQPATEEVVSDIERLISNWLPKYRDSDRSYITIAIGCTGGQHRSVYTTAEIVKRLEKQGWHVQVRHLHMIE